MPLQTCTEAVAFAADLKLGVRGELPRTSPLPSPLPSPQHSPRHSPRTSPRHSPLPSHATAYASCRIALHRR
jgi:hypothetical protein